MLSPTLYPDPGWERPDVDRLTGFLDELEDRLDYKHWYYGHFTETATRTNGTRCCMTGS